VQSDSQTCLAGQDSRTRRPISGLRWWIGGLCGALLGRAGHHLVLHLSASWGGLKQRIALLENVLAYGTPTSPKLPPREQLRQPLSP
jgi:hypothetical protein